MGGFQGTCASESWVVVARLWLLRFFSLAGDCTLCASFIAVGVLHLLTTFHWGFVWFIWVSWHCVGVVSFVWTLGMCVDSVVASPMPIAWLGTLLSSHPLRCCCRMVGVVNLVLGCSFLSWHECIWCLCGFPTALFGCRGWVYLIFGGVRVGLPFLHGRLWISSFSSGCYFSMSWSPLFFDFGSR
ncbi:hypothetical protein SUGI_0530930 [Cryptomeria japonica]|nr:hypothetical protein SUGI_0530930 [Cryptomeria japonica]